MYASSFDQGWYLYVYGTTGTTESISLGESVELGRWYRVQTILEAETGIISSRIWELHSGSLLLEREDQVTDWIPEDGLFDALMAYDGELSSNVTISNLAVLDNIRYSSDPSGAYPEGESSASTAGIRLSSNPLGRDGALSFTSEAGGAVTLGLFDAQGRSVLRQELHSNGGGLQEVCWSALRGTRSLPSGIYFLSISGVSGNVLTRRVVVAE